MSASCLVLAILVSPCTLASAAGDVDATRAAPFPGPRLSGAGRVAGPVGARKGRVDRAVDVTVRTPGSRDSLLAGYTYDPPLR